MHLEPVCPRSVAGLATACPQVTWGEFTDSSEPPFPTWKMVVVAKLKVDNP